MLKRAVDEFPARGRGLGGVTSAAEDDVLVVGADHGVVGGALRLEERAGEAFFMGWIQGGDSG